MEECALVSWESDVPLEGPWGPPGPPPTTFRKKGELQCLVIHDNLTLSRRGEESLRKECHRHPVGKVKNTPTSLHPGYVQATHLEL